MRNRSAIIYEINADLVSLFIAIDEIGWEGIRESSIHRIVYLASVLDGFVNRTDGDYGNYHFSISLSGPYSEAIYGSVIDLKRRDVLSQNDEGNLRVDLGILEKLDIPVSEKLDWFRIVIYILGLYGENKIYGFVSQDPEYKQKFQRNSQKELNISSENRTIAFLNQFRKAFEETLSDVSQINEQEYLELYFEYIFSKIIRKES